MTKREKQIELQEKERKYIEECNTKYECLRYRESPDYYNNVKNILIELSAGTNSRFKHIAVDAMMERVRRCNPKTRINYGAYSIFVALESSYFRTIKVLEAQIENLKKQKLPISNLELCRRNKNMTQQELSDASDVSIRCIRAYEQRVKNINHAQAITIIRLAKVLGCEMQDLLEDEFIRLYDNEG